MSDEKISEAYVDISIRGMEAVEAALSKIQSKAAATSKKPPSTGGGNAQDYVNEIIAKTLLDESRRLQKINALTAQIEKFTQMDAAVSGQLVRVKESLLKEQEAFRPSPKLPNSEKDKGIEYWENAKNPHKHKQRAFSWEAMKRNQLELLRNPPAPPPKPPAPYKSMADVVKENELTETQKSDPISRENEYIGKDKYAQSLTKKYTGKDVGPEAGSAAHLEGIEGYVQAKHKKEREVSESQGLNISPEASLKGMEDLRQMLIGQVDLAVGASKRLADAMDERAKSLAFFAAVDAAAAADSKATADAYASILAESAADKAAADAAAIVAAKNAASKALTLELVGQEDLLQQKKERLRAEFEFTPSPEESKIPGYSDFQEAIKNKLIEDIEKIKSSIEAYKSEQLVVSAPEAQSGGVSRENDDLDEQFGFPKSGKPSAEDDRKQRNRDESFAKSVQKLQLAREKLKDRDAKGLFGFGKAFMAREEAARVRTSQLSQMFEIARQERVEEEALDAEAAILAEREAGLAREEAARVRANQLSQKLWIATQERVEKEALDAEAKSAKEKKASRTPFEKFSDSITESKQNFSGKLGDFREKAGNLRSVFKSAFGKSGAAGEAGGAAAGAGGAAEGAAAGAGGLVEGAGMLSRIATVARAAGPAITALGAAAGAAAAVVSRYVGPLLVAGAAALAVGYAFKSIVNSAIPFVQALNPGLIKQYEMVTRDLTAVIGQALMPVVSLAVPIFRDFANTVAPLAIEFGAILESISLPMGEVLMAATAMAGAIGGMLMPIIKLLAGVFSGLSPIIVALFEIFQVAFDIIRVAFEAIWVVIAPVIKLFEVLAVVVQVIVKYVAGAFRIALAAIEFLLSDFIFVMEAIVSGLQVCVDWLKWFVDAVEQAIMYILSWIPGASGKKKDTTGIAAAMNPQTKSIESLGRDMAMASFIANSGSGAGSVEQKMLKELELIAKNTAKDKKENPDAEKWNAIQAKRKRNAQIALG